MNIDAPTALLGGLSPARFMRRHWQKKPLLVRQAWPGVTPPIDRAALFNLAGSADVESRLVTHFDGRWNLQRGPFSRRALPALKRPNWSLLVQGLDLHLDAAHAMLQPFRFVPEARLDDLMISWASDGGGVGPHTDSYDVFLLQVHGRRRWRIGRVADNTLLPNMPVKILKDYVPEEEWVLEPGDMLYLPPLWGHDGVAEGECMTCSVGFRAAGANEMARELLARLVDDDEDRADPIYRDAAQAATATPGALPASLLAFAQGAVARALARPQALARALGEVVTDPKPLVWFEPGHPLRADAQGLRLDRRTRMMYDDRHVFINGEAYRAGGRDARLMRQLADQRRLGAPDLAALSADARGLLSQWCQDGWAHGA
ncbi:hypothetical protein BurJ1DRAFT_2839 [Burkholderiales bacterium JOSHI_001]|nr:hypothetical protein BurJ1DRAFT_2839 [Burkholderiales bacterium JOSHI_001]